MADPSYTYNYLPLVNVHVAVPFLLLPVFLNLRVVSRTLLVPFSQPSVGPTSPKECDAFDELESAFRSNEFFQLWDG